MIAEYFLDSNVILYAYMDDDKNKKERAQEILAFADCCISSQVIGEVCCNLIRKAGFSEAEVMEIIDEFYSLYQVVPIDHGIFHTASHLRSAHSFSYWDSFIVSAAVEAGVNTLYSEDMQHGLKVNLPAPRGGASLAQLQIKLRRRLPLISMVPYILFYHFGG